MILAPRFIPRLASTVGLFTRYGLLDFARGQSLLKLQGAALDPDDVPADSVVTAPNKGSLNCGPAGLLNAVNGAREAGLDDLRLIPTTADPDEIDRAREVLGI